MTPRSWQGKPWVLAEEIPLSPCFSQQVEPSFQEKLDTRHQAWAPSPGKTLPLHHAKGMVVVCSNEWDIAVEPRPSPSPQSSARITGSRGCLVEPRPNFASQWDGLTQAPNPVHLWGQNRADLTTYSTFVTLG